MSGPHPSPRLTWLDFLRGLAVLGMIEAHSVNSFLHPDYRSGAWFVALSYLNGWVAPTFLFIAGLLQGLALRRNWSAPKPIGPRLRSLGLILLIGYGLQFPWNALEHLNQGGWQRIHVSLGRIDILHCLAVSLCFLLILSRIFKKQHHYDTVVLIMVVLVFLTSPSLWKFFGLDSVLLDHHFFGYLSPARGALFPLIPWFLYAAVGTLASRLGGLYSNKSSSSLSTAFFTFSLFAAALGWLLKWLLQDWLAGQSYAVRYDAILFRLSLVFAAAALCVVFLQPRVPHRLIRAINWAGGRSLSLYVFHLILLHSGLLFLPPLRQIFPRAQTPLTTFGLFLLTLGLTILLTWLWQKLFALISKQFSQQARSIVASAPREKQLAPPNDPPHH